MLSHKFFTKNSSNSIDNHFTINREITTKYLNISYFLPVPVITYKHIYFYI